MAEAKIALGKGMSFQTTIVMAQELAGAEKFAAVVAALPEATRALVAKPPHASEWIALTHEIALTDTLVEVGFHGDLEAGFRLGDLSFTHDLNGVYRTFLRLFSPEFIITRIPAIFNTYYRNAGSGRAVEHDARHVLVELSDMRTCSPAYFESIRGVVHAGGVATRVRKVHTRFTGGAGRATWALIEATWEK